MRAINKSLYFNGRNFDREIREKQTALEKADIAFSYERMVYEVDVMKNAQVIALTTSKMASVRRHFETLKPEIIVVEEAAEALEPHITASLPSSVDQLILIGDHK